MKTKMKLFKLYYWILAAVVVFNMSSCSKDNSLGFTPGTGAPTITSVRTVSKSVVDSSSTTTTTTYNSSGVPTTTTAPNYNPQVVKFDSTTVTGNLGNTYAVIGTNLGSTATIWLNGVSIYFNRALSSNTSIIFTIPSTVPTLNQSNTLKIVTLSGSVTYKFTVLSPPPTITTPSDYDFTAGSTITLKGLSFSTVTGVTLRTTGDVVQFSAPSDTVMILTMPTKSAVTESSLLFAYSAAGKAEQTASPQIFNDLDNGYLIFAKNSFQNGWADNSWSGPSGVSTAASHSGTASAEASYPAGGWQIEGWANWYPSFPYSAQWKYLTFWVKGGTVTHTLTLVGDKMVGGYGQNTSPAAIQQIVVPPTVWTFFKIPLGAPASTDPTLLNYWATGSPAQQLGFFLKGQSGDVNETMFFDEVAFIQ